MCETDDHQLGFKFVLVGDSAVGKTAICKRFCTNDFLEDIPQTVGIEFGSRIVDIQNTKVKIQIWDTAGQERFHAITRAYFRSSTAVFLVFDVTNRESFSHIASWSEDAVQYAPPYSMKILIGNKSDLTSSRNVTTEEASDFASNQGMTYFETSAYSGEKIEDAFMQAANTIYTGIQKGEIEYDNSIGDSRVSINQESLIPTATQKEGCGC